MNCFYVISDHGNTAQHYGGEKYIEPAENRWDERLQALDAYVEHLFQQDASSERNQQRKKIYNACRNADIDSQIQACDSPVGTGKTTAVMAHLLQVAIAKGLRHIIIVLPYTNIIKQSVEIYRRSLILQGEDPEKIVAEHHHQADFSDIESRQMATLWQAPVTVTTAVQFFETLGSSHPAKLRKLHELPGSAVFVDEAHSAIPTWLWPQTWLWLKELSQKWGCHFILASGTLPRFWQNKKFVDPSESIPDLIPKNLPSLNHKG
jgi:CRISPR-associated endonuclease/helicase Cas3